MLDGAIYGLASRGRFAGAFKPANRSPDLGGLYLAGGGGTAGRRLRSGNHSGPAYRRRRRRGPARQSGSVPDRPPAEGGHITETTDRGASMEPREGADSAPEISPALLGAFSRYTERYLAHHFHAVRLSRAQAPPRVPPERPLIVYLNHASWWDPLVCLELALRLYRERRHYGAIDAGALERYRLFGRLGFFGIEAGTPRGARQFLEVSLAILRRPGATLWVTPGGRFSDPRERPVVLRSGLGHLARRLKSGIVLPLALEYPFWEERCPEVLARFGEPVDIEEVGMRAADWTTLLAERLAEAQDALAAEALARDRAGFETLLGGRAGVGGVYDLWRRLLARFKGERFRQEHGDEES